MPSPFPGMDPYLEHPHLWPDVHNRLIASIGDFLGPLLRPRYIVALEERIYVEEPSERVLVGRPDLTVVERSGLGAASAPRASAVIVAFLASLGLPTRAPPRGPVRKRRTRERRTRGRPTCC